jgi:hypothetical protein
MYIVKHEFQFDISVVFCHTPFSLLHCLHSCDSSINVNGLSNALNILGTNLCILCAMEQSIIVGVTAENFRKYLGGCA